MAKNKNFALRLTDKEYYLLLALRDKYQQEFSLNVLIEMAITKLAKDVGIRYEPEKLEARDAAPTA